MERQNEAHQPHRGKIKEARKMYSIILVSAIVIIFLGMITFMTWRNRRNELPKGFLEGVQRGLQDYRAGRMKSWEEVKRDLGY